MKIEGSRIIVAADFPSLEPAVNLAGQIGKDVAAFKIGNEMGESVGAPQTVKAVVDGGSSVFRDSKLVDIPNTVAGAAAGLVQPGVVMFNMMCLGGKMMMAAAKQAAAKKASELGIQTPLALGVTVLTSLDWEALKEMRFFDHSGFGVTSPERIAEGKTKMVRDLVVDLAKLAQEAGLDGVIASAQEAAMIRAACGPEFLIVTPGIRGKDDPSDDQKRTMTAAEAVAAGADYLVIGRPITKAADPVAAVNAFNAEIAEALAANSLAG